jgi:oligoendopeptidase F
MRSARGGRVNSVEGREIYPRWDPSQIFSTPKSVEIGETFATVSEKAALLSRELRHRIAELDPEHLLDGIRRYEECVWHLQLVTSYAELLYGLHDQGPSVASLLKRCDTAWAELVTELGFFEEELAARGDQQDRDLGRYAHFVYKTRVAAAEKLAGPQEVVLAKLLPTGGEGWQRLAQELLVRIQVDIDGEPCSIGQALPSLYSPDRATRAAAHTSINRALEAELELRAIALNMVVADGETRAQLRGVDWLDSRHVVDQVRPTEVATLLAVADECTPIIHEYYEFKRTALAVGQLADYDRYAPLYSSDKSLSWIDATKIVVSSFGGIHPELEGLACRIIDEGCIDAGPRAGKQRSAFTRAIPGRLPCISMNFTGKLRDVLILAHEMGHAVHMQLAAEQPLLAATPPPVLSETVALFCEAATVRVLLAGADRRQQASCLARWLEDQMVAIGRHAALHMFEVDLRTVLRAEGALDADRIGRLWLAGQHRLYGPAFELTDGYQMWWSYLGQLFTDPGSNYSYIYGQLSALALLSRFEADPAGFGAGFHELLRAGDTRPPTDLLATVGVHTTEPGDWRLAAATLRDRVEQLRFLVAGDPMTSVLHTL